MKNITCFEVYFQPVYLYVKRTFELATGNSYRLTFTSTFFVTIAEILQELLKVDLFGIPNALLGLVILTILIDAYYGIRKSVKQSKEALVHAQFYQEGSPDYRRQIADTIYSFFFINFYYNDK